MAMEKGFIYYSIGDVAIIEARRSVRSLLRHMPEAKVTVFTEQPEKFEEYGVNTVKAPAKHGKDTRAHLLQQSPYEQTFYIDSDTFFLDSCWDMFDYLKGHDMALALSNLNSEKSADDETLFYNCGIIGYSKKNSSMEILRRWEEAIKVHLSIDERSKDEPPFAEVAEELKPDINILPEIYNFRPQLEKDVKDLDGVKLLHSHWAVNYLKLDQ